jgi:hypothetical protein
VGFIGGRGRGTDVWLGDFVRILSQKRGMGEGLIASCPECWFDGHLEGKSWSNRLWSRAMEIELLEGRVLFTHAAHLHHLATVAHAAHLATVAREAHHAATVAREAHTAKHVKHLAHAAHFLRTTVPAPLIMGAVERATWPTIRAEFLANLKRIPR